MKIKIFVSMSFKDKTEEDINRYLNYAEKYYRSYYSDILLDRDKIIAVCNYWFEAKNYVNKKLATLSGALKLMSNCDDFILFTNEDGSMPFGCIFELQAWNNSGTKEQTHNAIILNSSIVEKGDKNE